MLLLYSDNLSSLFQAVLRRAFNGQVHVLNGIKMVSNFVTKSDLRKKIDKIPRIITLTDKGRQGTHVILRGAGSLAMEIPKEESKGIQPRVIRKLVSPHT